jgi:hypothetical protein
MEGGMEDRRRKMVRKKEDDVHPRGWTLLDFIIFFV